MPHTPGPWTVQHYNDESTKCICAGEGDIRIASMEHEYEGDAHLIAAAPELLEALYQTNAALQIAMANLNGGVSSATILKLSAMKAGGEQAIAQAEGRI